MENQSRKAHSNNLDPTILREYDIRGIFGKTLNENDAYNIGLAFGTLVQRRTPGKSVAVGYDGRLSSPTLCESLIAGLIESGCDVAKIGLGPSPMLYFADQKLKCDGAVMITGSHNPKDHNGFKFVLSHGSLYGEDIKEIGRIISAKDYSRGSGSSKTVDIFDSYIDILQQAYTGNKALKIAWDPGNGAAGEVVSALAKKLPGEQIVINPKIDGNFPSHHPDPTEPENLEQLIECVKKESCDFGVAFDGDGDRIGVVDNRGRMLAGDQLLVIFARSILPKNPGATIIADIKSSKFFTDGVREAGGNPIIWKSGHSLIKAKMRETKALLAGEMSGHIFFADKYFGYDDGIYAAVRIMDVIAGSTKSLDKIIDDFPVMHNTPEYRIPCPDNQKFTVVESIKSRLKKSSVKFLDIDGVRVEKPDGWWLLRASNTQAALSARCEATSAKKLIEIKNEMLGELKKEGVKV